MRFIDKILKSNGNVQYNISSLTLTENKGIIFCGFFMVQIKKFYPNNLIFMESSFIEWP